MPKLRALVSYMARPVLSFNKNCEQSTSIIGNGIVLFMSTISHIDHIAIVVKNIEQARTFYENALGLCVSHQEDIPERGIRVAFIPIGKTNIELIEPLHDSSEVSQFINTRGPGLHHIALRSTNIDDAQKTIQKEGAVLVYKEARDGAHQTKINFVHPKSTGGVLIEIVS